MKRVEIIIGARYRNERDLSTFILQQANNYMVELGEGSLILDAKTFAKYLREGRYTIIDKPRASTVPHRCV